jgi:hypothetical protein
MIVLLLQLATATPQIAVGASPTPAVVHAGGQTRTLADVARERRLSGKKPIGAFSAAQVTSGPTATPEIDPNGLVIGRSASPSPSARAGATPAVEPTNAPDQEAEWRWKYSAVNDKVKKAEDALQKMEKETPVVTCVGQGCSHGPASVTLAAAEAARDTALAPYRIAVEDAKKERGALVESCRRTFGCQPGWVR